MISAMKSRFHFSYNTFRRKTQELKNTSAELEIKEKKNGLLVFRCQIVFLCSFWEMQSDK